MQANTLDSSFNIEDRDMGPRIDFLDIIEYIIFTYEKTFVGCTLVQLQADVTPDTMLSGNVLSLGSLLFIYEERFSYR